MIDWSNDWLINRCQAVLPFMKHLGYETMRRATDKLAAVSKNTVMPLLDKARADLPPPPAAAPKAPKVSIYLSIDILISLPFYLKL